MQHENQPSNTLYFDTPLPINRSWSARERNQLYFNMACKSQLLDWPRASRFDPPTKQPAENTDLVASNDPDSENLVYNYWTFGDMTLLLRHQIDGYLESNNEKRYCLVSAKLDYQLDHDREEISTAQERSNHWLRSFLAGHATLLEARVDVPNNRITRVDQKQMRDIMGDKWQPLQESELLRFLFTELHR
ncbi:hypothetical protein DM01DRAFT_1280127 [Hesseltinella vesiculosa]|uniref:Little elongation complex subunit 2 C-terminal domain-containing protein n=1 Tax=Hesseltinella vesiculosa TaxID=101127 RepID=A0A1X2GWN7_9FUNG|nr:hypothetical protein DM01DRAFT_1280127 [Hesseltinella vesiculosa]